MKHLHTNMYAKVIQTVRTPALFRKHERTVLESATGAGSGDNHWVQSRDTLVSPKAALASTV
jgi:hypothetical protein